MFLGLANVYLKLIQGFSQIVVLLTSLLYTTSSLVANKSALSDKDNV